MTEQEASGSIHPNNIHGAISGIPQWRPFCSPRTIIIFLFIFGIIYLISGFVFYFTSSKESEIVVRYDDICTEGSICSIKFSVQKPLDGNLFILYKLSGFYQNYRRLMASKSVAQLKGEYVPFDDLDSCDPLFTSDNSHDESKLLLPCGLYPRSFFNDTYSTTDPYFEKFSESGIALDSEREGYYQNISEKYTQGIRWLDDYTDFPGGVTNEHFIVWMRPAAMPTFYKIWSHCEDCKIPIGNYTFDIKMNYPVSVFHGKRYLALVQSSVFGSRPVFMSIMHICIGGVGILFSVIFFIQSSLYPRPFGDLSEIWNKSEVAEFNSENTEASSRKKSSVEESNTKKSSSDEDLDSLSQVEKD